MAKCEHLNFKSIVMVNRLTDTEGGPVTGYNVEVAVKCADCGWPFQFKGLPYGYHPEEPRLSFDGLELRAPIEPRSHNGGSTNG